MPDAPPPRLDAGNVAGAAASVLMRTLGGITLGLVVGIVVFVVERAAGWLDAAGWARAAVWLLLPAYAIAGACVLGFVFAVGGVRRAAQTLLVDTGALRRMVERGLARVRKADEARAAGEPDEPAPRGWVGTRIHGLGRSISRVLVERLRSTAAPEAETAATIDQAARMMIDEWSETPVYLALAALALLFVAPPLLIAFT